MSRVPRQLVLLLAMLAIVPGCQSSEESLEDDLKQLGVTYLSFIDVKQESPSDWEELITFAEENDMWADEIRRARDAGCTVTWDLEIDPATADTTVLAEPPGEGRRLMADGGLER